MFSTTRTAGLLAGFTVAVVVAMAAVATTATAAPATSGSTLSPGDTCANPLLASNASGWTMTSGGHSKRVAITGHVVAKYALQTTTTLSTASMMMPAQALTAGQSWTFAADSLISGTGTVRVGVDFYDSSGTRFSHVDGQATSVGASTWQRVSVSTTAPTNAASAVLIQTASLTKGAQWSSTACDYATSDGSTSSTDPTSTTTPTSTTMPPTSTTAPPTTTTSPNDPGDGTQAATIYNWGTPTDGDEFNGTSVSTSKWYLYNSAGQDGEGLRRPSQITASNGVMTISGTSKGTTGGMASQHGYKYGRWETRMRVPSGDHRYHPVLILWPDAEDWPKGGEVDYAETTAAATDIDFFLHYSSANDTTTNSVDVDLTQWHNYAVQWTSKGITGYVDGVKFFSDTNTKHSPPRAMHQTIQLDWFPNGNSSTTPSSLQVAWNRYYPA